MGDTTGAVRGVDSLTSRPGSAHELELEVAVPDTDGDLSRLGQDRHTVRHEPTVILAPGQ